MVSIQNNPPTIKIKEIDETYLNQKIKISGHVSKIINIQGFQIITLNESKEIEIINNKPKNISKNQKIIVIGKVQEYKNKLQISSEKLYITTLKLS